MKSSDPKELRRLIRAANSASWKAHHLQRVALRFMATDENNEIHVNGEDSLAFEILMEDLRETIVMMGRIVGGELSTLLGIDIDKDMEGEPPMEEAYKEYQAAQIIESANWHRRTAV